MNTTSKHKPTQRGPVAVAKRATKAVACKRPGELLAYRCKLSTPTAVKRADILYSCRTR